MVRIIEKALAIFTWPEYASRAMMIETPSDLIDAFGGTGKTAAIFGVLPSAVSNWRAAGRFPDRLHLRILNEARARGIDISYEFFDQQPAELVAS